MNSFLVHFKADARHFQLICLASFLCLGIFSLGWAIHFYKYFLIFASVITFQIFFSKLENLPLDGIKSACITGFGLSLLFHSSQPILYVAAAFFAIAGKFIFRYNGKHFINPANLGICLTYIFFGNSWISPGQWGSSLFFLLVLSLAGMAVLYKARRIEVGVVFIIFYLALEFSRNILYRGWPLDFFQHQFTNGALLLFSFFMITDPCSTPNHRGARVFFAIAVALLAFYLSSYKFVIGAPVWALFALCPLTPLLDKWFASKRYYWLPSV